VSGIGGTLAALTMAVACGDAFGDGNDCKASRTCAETGGDSGSEGGSAGGPASGATAGQGEGGDGTTAQGGDGGAAGGAAGAAGAAGAFDGGCRAAADCSNDDPADGEEVCNNRQCVAGNPPPTVVSVSPKDAAVDIELDAKVAIKFSEPLDAKTVTPATVRVLDGKTVVPGSLQYANDTVTFTPTSPLALLAPYTVVVTTGVEDAEGAPLLSEYTSEFSTRDGAWKTVDAANGSFWALSDGLPISAEGDVLVAWAGMGNQNCPVTATWLRRGMATSTKVFDADLSSDCGWVSSGGNAAGVASVVWNIPNSAHGTYAQQYRAGAWQANPSLVSKDTHGHDLHVAVAPSGVVTLFEQGDGDSEIWRTDAAGKWPTMGNVLSSAFSNGRVSVAYDPEGNGFAVWHSIPSVGGIERIVVSRFDAASGKWSTATDLPGSVAATAPTGDALRGIPVVAVDNEGGAMALWVNASVDGKLMASRYSPSTGWDAPEPISGTLVVESRYERPALVFDGEVFVAAWTALEAGKRYTFTARYEATTGWGAYAKQQVTAADGTSALKMPRLVSDDRGSSLLVFAKGAAPTFSLVYQRYAHGAWNAIKAVPGGTVANQSFENNVSILALSMNDSGLAALSWGNYEDNRISAIRLASFY
jgi:hypothetical protein